MDLNKIAKQLSRILLPVSRMGGLQMTNTSLRFLEMKEEKGKVYIVRDISLRLPPGIVDGRVKDRNGFISALKKLHSQIEPNLKKNINVILSIPTGVVYAEAFVVPNLVKNTQDEAAELNLKVLAPDKIENLYYSWMVVGEGEGKPVEFLGAFAQKEIINEINFCLEEANFGIAAIEFSSLSLARIMSHYGLTQPGVPYLLIKMTAEGLIFMIIRNNNLYFDYFHSWDKVEAESRGIPFKSITEIIYSESQRVLNFYSSKWGGQIKNIIFISPALVTEISQFLNSKYPTFEIEVLSSEKENLHGVRGAALRGLSPRTLDSEINLMNSEQINAFFRDEILSFINLLRNIVFTTLVFIGLIFGASDFLLKRQLELEKASAVSGFSEVQLSEFASLQERVNLFNSLVAKIQSFQGTSFELSPYIDRINSVIDSTISISSISLRVSDASGSIQAIARDQNSAINFRNRLQGVQELQDVNLPFSSRVVQQDGRVSFTISFKLRKA